MSDRINSSNSQIMKTQFTSTYFRLISFHLVILTHQVKGNPASSSIPPPTQATPIPPHGRQAAGPQKASRGWGLWFLYKFLSPFPHSHVHLALSHSYLLWYLPYLLPFKKCSGFPQMAQLLDSYLSWRLFLPLTTPPRFIHLIVEDIPTPPLSLATATSHLSLQVSDVTQVGFI